MNQEERERFFEEEGGTRKHLDEVVRLSEELGLYGRENQLKGAQMDARGDDRTKETTDAPATPERDIKALVEEAREAASRVEAVVTDHRSDPDNDITAHRILNVYQQEADLWNALCDALEAARGREGNLERRIEARIETEEREADLRDRMNGIMSCLPGDLLRAKVAAYREILGILGTTDEGRTDA